MAAVALLTVACAGCADAERRDNSAATSAAQDKLVFDYALDFSGRADHRLNQVLVSSGDPMEPDEEVLDACRSATTLPANWTKPCRQKLDQALADGRELVVYASNDHASLSVTAERDSDTLSINVCRETECQRVSCGDSKDGDMAEPVPVLLRSLPCRDEGNPRKVTWTWQQKDPRED